MHPYAIKKGSICAILCQILKYRDKKELICFKNSFLEMGGKSSRNIFLDQLCGLKKVDALCMI